MPQRKGYKQESGDLHISLVLTSYVILDEVSSSSASPIYDQS